MDLYLFMFYICNQIISRENNLYLKYMSNPNIDLTARELEVLELLSYGYNSKDIAEKLFISPNTVEYHRKQLLRKTASRNAAELIGNAFRLKILSTDD